MGLGGRGWSSMLEIRRCGVGWGWGTRQRIPRVSLGGDGRTTGKSGVQLSFEVCDAKLESGGAIVGSAAFRWG